MLSLSGRVHQLQQKKFLHFLTSEQLIFCSIRLDAGSEALGRNHQMMIGVMQDCIERSASVVMMIDFPNQIFQMFLGIAVRYFLVK